MRTDIVPKKCANFPPWCCDIVGRCWKSLPPTLQAISPPIIAHPPSKISLTKYQLQQVVTIVKGCDGNDEDKPSAVRESWVELDSCPWNPLFPGLRISATVNTFTTTVPLMCSGSVSCFAVCCASCWKNLIWHWRKIHTLFSDNLPQPTQDL